MDDLQHLLTMAAKAAGIRIDKSPYNGGGSGNTGFDLQGNAVLDWHNAVTWAPHTDDGDSRRLQVALHMTMAHEPSRGGWSVGAVVRGEFAWLAHDDNARLAVLRAAAAIGEAMP